MSYLNVISDTSLYLEIFLIYIAEREIRKEAMIDV